MHTLHTTQHTKEKQNGKNILVGVGDKTKFNINKKNKLNKQTKISCIAKYIYIMKDWLF